MRIALRKHPVTGGVIASLLVILAFIGKAELDRRRHMQTDPTSSGKNQIEATVTIQRPVSEVFAFYRDFRNLPKFWGDVMEVEPTGPATSFRRRQRDDPLIVCSDAIRPAAIIHPAFFFCVAWRQRTAVRCSREHKGSHRPGAHCNSPCSGFCSSRHLLPSVSFGCFAPWPRPDFIELSERLVGKGDLQCPETPSQLLHGAWPDDRSRDGVVVQQPS
jgi:hypothetical protein